MSTLTGLGRLFTVGAVLVLATWWFTYFRRRQAQRRGQDVELAAARHPAVTRAGAVDPTGGLPIRTRIHSPTTKIPTP